MRMVQLERGCHSPAQLQDECGEPLSQPTHRETQGEEGTLLLKGWHQPTKQHMQRI